MDPFADNASDADAFEAAPPRVRVTRLKDYGVGVPRDSGATAPPDADAAAADPASGPASAAPRRASARRFPSRRPDSGFSDRDVPDNGFGSPDDADDGITRSSDHRVARAGRGANASGNADPGFSRSSDKRTAPRRREPPDNGFSTPDAPVEGFSRSSDRRAARQRPATRDDDSRADDTHAASPRRPDGPSLKARAVDYLSRREHSRPELARKLARWSDDPQEIDAVIDDLAREGWMSAERFVQSVVHRRAPRLGTTRVMQELRQHGIGGVELDTVKAELRATEFSRAQAVWQKRFGEAPADREAWAKQARFLAARGFSHDVIRRVLGQD